MKSKARQNPLPKAFIGGVLLGSVIFGPFALRHKPPELVEVQKVERLIMVEPPTVKVEIYKREWEPDYHADLLDLARPQGTPLSSEIVGPWRCLVPYKPIEDQLLEAKKSPRPLRPAR